MKRKVIVIGSGPAGLTACIYLARANLSPLLIAGSKFGGQLMWTSEVENYPGFPEGITGPELMSKMLEQAKKFGTEIIYDDATKVNFKESLKEVYVNDMLYKADSVIVSTGARPRFLEIPGETEYLGRGVSTCATCDGAFYKDKVVTVVGGGDSACEEANFLTKFATKVYLIVRKDKLRASKIMADRVKNNKKIEILYNHEVEVITGTKFVESINIVNNLTKDKRTLTIDGIFIAIGHLPNTEIFKDQLDLDEADFILKGSGTNTSSKGVFAAGELIDHHYKQAITSAGTGCMAALDCERYLE